MSDHTFPRPTAGAGGDVSSSAAAAPASAGAALVRSAALPDQALHSASGRLTLRARPGVTIVLLLHEVSITAQALADVAGRTPPESAGLLPSPTAFRRLAPGQTLLIDTKRNPAALHAWLRPHLDARVHWLDQSHGRTLIETRGPAAAEALAHGIGIDLDIACFPVGASGQTMVGHIGVNLARVGADEFELIVMRSYADALWGLLARRVHQA